MMDVQKGRTGKCKVRLRIGGGERPRLEVNTNSPPVAKARGVRMQAVAAACVRAQMPTAEILLMMQTLAEQETEAAFCKIEQRALKEAIDYAPAAAEPKRRARTFQELASQWVSGELTAEFRHKVPPLDPETAKKAGQRLARMYPTLGNVPLEQITERLADEAIGKLPKMATTTMGQHQALVRRVMRIAASLDLIAASPIKPGWGLSVKSSRANSFMYPENDRQLLACIAIEFAYRLLWGFLAREGSRLDEALELEWRHYNAAHGLCRVEKHKTRRKGSKPREWKLEPGTNAALKWWYFECQRQGRAKPTDRIFPALEGLTEKEAASMVREHLKTAGVDRPEFWENNEDRMWFHVHSLRVTFVTLALAAGWSEQMIMSKTGHETSTQLHDYDAGASLARNLGMTKFLAPLDEALGLTKGAAANDGSCDVRGDAPGTAPAGDPVEQAGGARGLGAADPGVASDGAGVRVEALGTGGTVNARSLGSDGSDAAALVAGAVRDGALPGTGPDRDHSASVTQCGSDRPGGVGQRVGQKSRTSRKHAGPGGLLQTPGGTDPQTPARDSADLHGTGDGDEQLGPPEKGGVVQTKVAQVDAETALANALASAVAQGQLELAQGILTTLRERQLARMAPDVAQLEQRRIKGGR